MIMLLKALTAFFILVYIHVSYSQTPATCLEHLKTDWPRDGILRVEILRPSDERIQLREGAEDMSEDLSMPRNTNKGGMISIDPSTTLPHEEKPGNEQNYQNFLTTKPSITSQSKDSNDTVMEVTINGEFATEYQQNATQNYEMEKSSEALGMKSTIIDSSIFKGGSDGDMLHTEEIYSNETLSKMDSDSYEELLKSDVPEVEKLVNAGEWSEMSFFLEHLLTAIFL